MKKVLAVVIIFLYVQVDMCMEQKAASAGTIVTRATQTVHDKWNPTTIVSELQSNGVSRDQRERMTQMHRLDRIVPFHIDRQNPERLCDDLTIIITQDYPLSSIARTMAQEYLWQLRSSTRENKCLLDRITATLDLLNPTQIIDDVQRGHIYSEASIDLENRLNRAMEQLVTAQDTHNLMKLISVIIARNARERTALIPGKRILQSAYRYLSTQEKQAGEHKASLIKSLEAEEKSDSDSDEEDNN